MSTYELGFQPFLRSFASFYIAKLATSSIKDNFDLACDRMLHCAHLISLACSKVEGPACSINF